MSTLYLIGRIILGAFFIYNAYGHFSNIKGMGGYAASKGIPMPEFSVIFTGLMLLLGGLGILLGVHTTIAIAILVIFLLGTTFMMHNFWKETDGMMKMTQRIQFTKNLAIVAALLMLLALPIPWLFAAF